MSTPYIGEIRLFAGNFAPFNWAFCDGAVVSISQNPTLFQLIGTTYGGDGQNTFNLPDLRGRVPLHMGRDNAGNSYALGQNSGVETVTLTNNQIPAHTHALLASTDAANQTSGAGNALAASNAIKLYSPFTPSSSLATGTLQYTGNNQPHENRQPYLGLNFIIALVGIFPTPN